MTDYGIALLVKTNGKTIRSMSNRFSSLIDADIAWRNTIKIFISYLDELGIEELEAEAGLFVMEGERHSTKLRGLDSQDFIEINGRWYSRGVYSSCDDHASRLIIRNHELEQICAYAYQVVGTLASDAGRFDEPEVDRVLTMLSDTKFEENVLPFSSKSSLQETSPLSEKYFLEKCLSAIKYDIEENTGREPSSSISRRFFDEIYNQAKNANLI